MTETQKETERICPNCAKKVDPLRAKAVSVVNGQIVHYCTPTCRAEHLKRGIPPKPSVESETDIQKPEVAGERSDEKADDEKSASEDKPDVDKKTTFAKLKQKKKSTNTNTTAQLGDLPGGMILKRQWLQLLPMVRINLLEAIIYGGVLVALVVVPFGLLSGWLHLGLAAAGIVVYTGFGVVRERNRGPANLFETIVTALTASLLAVGFVFSEHPRLFVFSAVGCLFIEKVGRIFEFMSRCNSTVADVLSGQNEGFLAREWRDNSVVAANLRRVSMVLVWARLPIAVGVAALAWYLVEASVAQCILAGATALLALNPRILRTITGDAHMRCAIRAAHKGVVIRDAHAVHRLGNARVVLFMAKQVLFESKLEIGEWSTVAGVDETQLLGALASCQRVVAQKQPNNRFSEAVADFAKERSVQTVPVDEVTQIQGVGIVGNTSIGELLCGTRELFLDRHISTAALEVWADTVEKSGRRAFFVGLGDQLCASFCVSETPVSDANETMSTLAQYGMEPAMITSAEAEAAIAMGGRIGIENVKFQSGERALEKVLCAFNQVSDSAVLVGNGQAFEENLRSAAVAICIGAKDAGMAGIDARKKPLSIVAELAQFAKDAQSSVRHNLVVAVAVMMVGVALSLSWHSPSIALMVCGLGAVASVFSTINGPFRLWDAAGGAVGGIFKKVKSLLAKQG